MDPFYQHPYRKPFYHPSSQKKLGNASKETYLGTLRKSENENLESFDDKLHDEILRGSNVYTIQRTGDADFRTNNNASPSFDESWPQSDRPSSVSILEDEDLKSVNFTKHRNRVKMQEDDRKNSTRTDKESMASKYVERFRTAEPLSRDDRKKQQTINREDFWWLKSAGSKSEVSPKAVGTKKDAGPKSEKEQANKLSTDALRKFDRETGNDGFVWKNLDEKSRVLQEKVDKLLDETESSLNSSRLASVSTIGLGSEATSTSGSSFEEVLYRPEFVRKRDLAAKTLEDLRKSKEEDILDQWRRRRRMDLIKERGVPRAANIPLSSRSDHSKDSVLDAFRKRLIVAEQDEGDINETNHDENDRLVFTGTQSTSKDRDAETQTQLMRDAVVQTSLEEKDGDHQPVEERTSNVSVQTTDVKRVNGIASNSLLGTGQCDKTRKFDDDMCKQNTNKVERLSNDQENGANLVVCCNEGKSSESKGCDDEPVKLSRYSVPSDNEISRTDYIRVDEAKSNRTSSNRRRNGEFPPDAKHSVGFIKHDCPSKDVERVLCDDINSRPVYDDGATQTLLADEKNNERKKKKIHISKQSLRNSVTERPSRGNDMQSRNISPVSNNASRTALDSVVFDSSASEAVSPLSGNDERGSRSRHGDEGMERLSLPRSHSSPTRLKNVINQVISERLFGSSGSVISSLEDMRSSLGTAVDSFIVTEPIHSDDLSRPLLIHASQPASSTDLENAASSDGEEFKDDEILQDLRRRRASYIQRLQLLDQAIFEEEQKQAAS